MPAKLSDDKRVVENPDVPIAIGIKRGDDIDKGIVKWLVEMIDETNEVTVVARY